MQRFDLLTEVQPEVSLSSFIKVGDWVLWANAPQWWCGFPALVIDIGKGGLYLDMWKTAVSPRDCTIVPAPIKKAIAQSSDSKTVAPSRLIDAEQSFGLTEAEESGSDEDLDF